MQNYQLPVALLLASSAFISDALAAGPSGIDYSMYFNADVRDAEYCQLTYSKKRYDYGQDVTNPAMTCPDAFSWQLFTEVVHDRFWSNWAQETQNWPVQPYPLCTADQSPATASCCMPGSNDNDKDHCPVFPGDKYSKLLKLLDGANDSKAATLLSSNPELILKGRPSILEHGKNLKRVVHDTKSQQCSAAQIASLIPENYESKGRIMRQTNNEITVRNRPFHYYLFRNDLYNANGVLEVFKDNAANQLANAPFHQSNESAKRNADAGKQQLTTIDLPPAAIMIKSNWIYQGLAEQLGMLGDNNQYITKTLTTPVCVAKDKNDETCDQTKHPENYCDLTGPHYLLAFHISSKDVPQWVWTTFEHVDNPGRCDFTGCNDAFGYKSPETAPGKNAADNYLKPRQHSDQLSSPSTVYNRDTVYPKEQIRPELATLFKARGIATGLSTSRVEPDPEDKAWLNYRLKGSQVNFVDHTGRSTLLGNSITEAGFMQQSSCISCHSRAGVHLQASVRDGKATESAEFLRLSVFERQLSDFGYQQSVHNTPKPEWFYNNDDQSTLDVLQTDFIWGFLFARPLCTDGNCK
ncbi:hypothetical protein ACFOEE_00095 [Pseudoalteromonas fenneropenaei]|uniref:Cytochrome c domain-containing protein n=1 Tax=Pseudoalteromonas fenneropenaei TaxID=1737459 RepID=A0ABV7CER3_9GAMM